MNNVFGKNYNVVSEVNVNGKLCLIVELSHAHYVDGLLTKYVVGPSQFDTFSNVKDKVEVVSDSE